MPTTLTFSKSAASVDHLGHTPRHRPDEFPVPANEIETGQKIVRRGNVNKSILRHPISTKFSQVVRWWASDVSAWKCRLERSSQVTGESRPGVTNIYQQFFVILAVTLIQPNTAAGINRATAGLKGWNLFWDLSWYTTIGIIKNFGAFWLGNTKILKFEIFWGVSISFAGTVTNMFYTSVH